MKKRVGPPFDAEAAKSAVVVVGPGGGRGFVMESAFGRGKHMLSERLIVTAAHCLPSLPPAHPLSYLDEKIYLDVLSSLEAETPHIPAECIYVDPVADIAILAEPDVQDFFERWEEYNALVQAAGTIQLSTRDPAKGIRGWLLSLDGRWQPCQVSSMGQYGQRLLIADATSGIVGGMSGSPILLDDGKVVGLVSVSIESPAGPETQKAGPQPRLSQCLPVWVVKSLSRQSKRRRITKKED